MGTSKTVAILLGDPLYLNPATYSRVMQDSRPRACMWAVSEMLVPEMV